MIGLTDTQWLCIRPFLHSGSGIYVGNETRCRLFVAALCWMARSGASWHRLPAAYGKWKSVYHRYTHWCDQGSWPSLMAYLRAKPELSASLLDSTVGRAHVSAAGAPKKKGLDPVLGRSRGGFSSKIHTLIRTRVKAWTGAPLPRLIADRTYDNGTFRAWLAQQAIKVVIPAQGRRLPSLPSPMTGNSTRRAMPWNGALAGSSTSGAWPLVTTNTHIVSWVFCIWLGLESG